MKKLSFLITTLLLSACLQQPSANNPTQQIINDFNQSLPNLPPNPPAETLLPVTDFQQWKAQFYDRAVRAGHQPNAVKRLLDGAEFQQKTVQADRSQPEANPMIWQYLDKSVTNQRINQAKQLLAGRQFKIPAEYVGAIWGMESAFGKNMGKNYLPSSLATLAFEGRRREFAENQLLAMLSLLERGDLSWDNLYGSWAGGMGHTQFIPTTFLEFGQDGNGDGRRDPFNEADALASTAHYLSASGWQAGAWGEVVQLPANFDYDLLDQKLSPKQLNSAGVRRLNGKPIDREGKVWLPAGVGGSALLLYKNFDVIKVYNNSNNYALAISLLADGIAGRTTQLEFPRHETGLNSNQIKALQNKLNGLGYAVGTADGKIGSKTRQAFKAWQKSQGRIPDGFISDMSVQGLLP